MKKLFVVLLVSLLVACSGSVTKTCSIEESGLAITITATAPAMDKSIEKLRMTTVTDFEAMGIPEAMLTDEIKTMFKEQIAQNMVEEFAFGEEEAVKIVKSEFKGTKFEVVIDVNAKVLTDNGYYDVEDAILQSFVNDLSESGFTCK